jgi:hypothetical protein
MLRLVNARLTDELEPKAVSGTGGPAVPVALSREARMQLRWRHFRSDRCGTGLRRVSERMCKQVSVSLPYEGDSDGNWRYGELIAAIVAR